MTTAIKRRRGTTAEHSTFVGLEGELTVDVTKDTVVVHDGSTTGGFPLLREDLSNNANVLTTTNTKTLSNKTLDLASNTVTGTLAQFNAALSDSNFVDTTFTQTIDGVKTFSSNPVLSAGTANGVLYLNGSKVATSGSALTFDGTNLSVGGTAPSNAGYTNLYLNNTSGAQLFLSVNGVNSRVLYSTATSLNYYTSDASPHVWQISGSEQMRLTSTGLGIGTSSPGAKLDVVNASGRAARIGGFQFSGTTSSTDGGNNLLGSGVYWNGSNLTATQTSGAVVQLGNGVIQLQTLSGLTAGNTYSFAPQITLDSSGNLGLGVTPSAWQSGRKALQVGNASINSFSNSQNQLGANFYYDGTNNKYISSDFSTVYQQLSGQHQWYTAASGTAGGNTSFSQVMTLNASGNLGVGTTSPIYKLDADSTAGTVANLNSTNSNGPGLRFGRSGTANGYVGSAKYIVGGALADFGIDVSGANNLIFGTNDIERARIDASGNLLVGTTSAVGGTSLYAGAFAGNSKDGLHLQDTTTTSGTVFAAWVNSSGTIIGSVSRVTTTNAVAYNTTSDVRLKSNVQNALPVLDKLMQIQVRQYDWTDGDLHQEYGFVAQELEPVISGVVTKGKTEEDMWQLDYAKLTPHLVKAIQEQQAIIEQLKARLDAANL